MAEISQNNWLKVNPDRNHCNHYPDITPKISWLATGPQVALQTSPCNKTLCIATISEVWIDLLHVCLHTPCCSSPCALGTGSHAHRPFFYSISTKRCQSIALEYKPVSRMFLISSCNTTTSFSRLFLSLWTLCWLARTSHRPISRTVWLKSPCVNPNLNLEYKNPVIYL
eukprot:1141880-Pelagomonas_calceolata.AAC.3